MKRDSFPIKDDMILDLYLNMLYQLILEILLSFKKRLEIII